MARGIWRGSDKNVGRGVFPSRSAAERLPGAAAGKAETGFQSLENVGGRAEARPSPSPATPFRGPP